MHSAETSFQVGHWTIDPLRRTAVSPGTSESLSANEVRLLFYLASRSAPVKRAELLTEVFDYAPSVRSRAADMALTRLRSKLERDPAHPELLLSKRGVGVWLEGRRAPHNTPLEGPPRFGSPYVPRPTSEASVRALWEAGWRIVTVVGPGGAGKTRLTLEVASGIEGETIFLGAAGATPEDLVDRLTARVGAVSGEPVALSRAMEARATTVVLDEAEQALEACRILIATLPSTRFLVSSRQPLHVEGEGIHALQGLSLEEGRSFLRSRLAASRWGSDASDQVLDGIRAQVDGLPLGLELAASYPDGLEVLLEQLESGQRPPGAWLTSTLARSLDPLGPTSRELLCALSLVEGALTRDELVDWRGPGAADALMDLADRSLLQRSGRGWVLLRSVRAAALELPADRPRLQREFDSWLLRRVTDLGFELDGMAGPAIRRWHGLEPDLTAALDRASPTDLGALIHAAIPFFDALGPRRRRDDVIRRALVAAPSDARVVCLSALLPEHWGETTRIQPALEHPDPAVRALGFGIQADVRHGSARTMRDLLPQIDDPRLRLQLEARCFRLELAAGSCRTGDARAFLARLQPRGLLCLVLQEALARHALRNGEPRQAASILARSHQIAQAEGLTRYAHFFRFSTALALGEADPAEGIEALRRLIAEEPTGLDLGVTLFRLAELLYLNGDLEAVLECLDQATPVMQLAQVMASTLEQVAAARLGRSELGPFRPQELDPGLARPIERWFEAERCLLVGDPSGAQALIEGLQDDPLEQHYSLRRLVTHLARQIER